MIVKKLHKKEKSKFDAIRRYYNILSVMDDWNLSERELQLLAFTAVKGNITYADIREEFCNTFKSSGPTINNIVSKLSKRKLFVKDGDKVKVNPLLIPGEDNNIAIIIQQSYEG